MKRLNEKHPTVIKLEKLFEFAEDLGLTITVDRWGKYIVNDKEFPSRDFYIKDAENNDTITSIPSDLEYKLVYGE